MEKPQMVHFGDGKRLDDSHKPSFYLLLDSYIPFEEQILTRSARRMTYGKHIYGSRNWEAFDSQEALDRTKDSLYRHVIQWMTGENDEDHLAAILCNVVIAASVEWRIKENDNG